MKSCTYLNLKNESENVKKKIAFLDDFTVSNDI